MSRDLGNICLVKGIIEVVHTNVAFGENIDFLAHFSCKMVSTLPIALYS